MDFKLMVVGVLLLLTCGVGLMTFSEPACPECPAVAETEVKDALTAVRAKPQRWEIRTEKFLIRESTLGSHRELVLDSKQPMTDGLFEKIRLIEGVEFDTGYLRYRRRVSVGGMFDRREVAAAIMRALDPEGMDALEGIVIHGITGAEVKGE